MKIMKQKIFLDKYNILTDTNYGTLHGDGHQFVNGFVIEGG